MTLKDRQLGRKQPAMPLWSRLRGSGVTCCPMTTSQTLPGGTACEVTTPSGHTFLALGETKEEALAAALDEIEQGLGS